MLNLIWDNFFVWVLPFLGVLSLLVFIHELGHYWVAKWCGVGIEEFSIGFGREIYGRNDRHGTRWKIGWLPLGGYVRMAGDRNAYSAPDGQDAVEMSDEEKIRSFHLKPLWARAAVVAAGPIANFLIAIVGFVFLYSIWGQPSTPANVGYVEPNSPAASAGFQVGDRIVELDGKAVESYEDLSLTQQLAIDTPMLFTIERAGKQQAISVTPERREQYAANCRKFSFNVLGLMEPMPVIVGATSPDGAANGVLERGDVVTAVNGQPVTHFVPFAEEVRKHAGKPVSFDVERGGDKLAVTLTPNPQEICGTDGVKTTIGLIGMSRQADEQMQQLGLVPAFSAAVSDTWAFTTGSLKALWQILTATRSAKDLGGPIGIADMVGSAAKVGWAQLLFVGILLSINLGLFNLLPIPVLDGGHLMMYAYEAVARKPMGERAQEWAFRAGFFLIIMLMVFVTFNEVSQRMVG